METNDAEIHDEEVEEEEQDQQHVRIKKINFVLRDVII